MLKKFQTLKEFSSGLSIDARILEFLDFFEHYSVSCAPCPKNHESVDPGGGGGELIYIYIYKHTHTCICIHRHACTYRHSYPCEHDLPSALHVCAKLDSTHESRQAGMQTSGREAGMWREREGESTHEE